MASGFSGSRSGGGLGGERLVGATGEHLAGEACHCSSRLHMKVSKHGPAVPAANKSDSCAVDATSIEEGHGAGCAEGTDRNLVGSEAVPASVHACLDAQDIVGEVINACIQATGSDLDNDDDEDIDNLLAILGYKKDGDEGDEMDVEEGDYM